MKKQKPTPRPAPRADYSPLLILGAVLVAYFPALTGAALWDDPGHMTRPDLRSLQGLWRIWTEPGATQQYYPLLHSAFWLEHRLWGDAMLGYHLANVTLHAIAAMLLVVILRHLAVRGALLAGFIFALHPVCAESVAWVSEQKNTLSAVFYMASALVYLRSREMAGLKASTTTHTSYWIAFALFVCALLSKSVTATLPAALLLVIWWRRGRLEWETEVAPLVPWFVTAAAAGAVSVWFEHTVIGAQGGDFSLTLVERVLLAGRVIWFYVAKLFWPHELIFIYPRWTIDASQWWQYLYPLAAVGVGLLLALFHFRGSLAGYLYFCGTLVPVLGFVNVYPFRFSFVADHFQYLASLGVIVPVASGLMVAWDRMGAAWMPVRRVASIALLTTLGILTWNRSYAYQDLETLFRDTIARNPQAWMAYQNLGTDLANRGMLAEAIEAYEGALRVRPGYTEAENNLVLAHMRLADSLGAAAGREAEAIAHYEAVLRIDPNHFRAHYNLGTILMDIPTRHADAVSHLEKAAQLEPSSIEAHVNLGVALADDPRRHREAIEHLEIAIAKKPDLPVKELLMQLRDIRP